jgi:hypothetical protein
VHGRSIAWTRDRCRLQGAYRSLLYAVAVHADRHYGACSAGTRRLAASAGISATWVKRLLHELVDMGVLECLEPGAGRRAACYRFTPSLLEHETRSGQPTSPQPSSVVVNSPVRSGQVGDAVVVTPPSRNGQLGAGPYRNEEKSIEEKDVEESASSAPLGRALDAGRAVARPTFPTPIIDALPDPETWKAVLALDPDAHRDAEGPTGGGWHLSDRYGRAWLRDRDAARWVEQHRLLLDEQTSQPRSRSSDEPVKR